MSVPVGRRSVAPGPPDLNRLASYGRGGRSRRRLPVLPVLVVLLLLAVGGAGFLLGRLTAPDAEPAAAPAAGPQPTAVVTTAPAVPITAAVIHEIKQGENLQTIADLYGVTQEQLIAFNDIADPNKIFWGLRLRIPPADFVPPTTAPATTAAP